MEKLEIGEEITEEELKKRGWEFTDYFGESSKIYKKGKQRILYNFKTKKIELFYNVE